LKASVWTLCDLIFMTPYRLYKVSTFRGSHQQMIKKKNSKQHKYHSFPSMGCGISVLTAMEGGNAKKCMEHLWPDTKKPQWRISA